MALTLSVNSFQVPVTPNVGLATEFAFGADFACATRVTSEAKIVRLIDHRIDCILQLQDFALDFNRDLLGQVPVGHRRGHLGDVTHLAGQVTRHRIDAVGEILPGPRHPLNVGLAAQPPFRTHFAATRVTSAANERSWSTIVLTVFFSSRISPLTSTVIFLDRSPLATAVVTSAILRTWPVKLLAMKLTLSVRSFQVPATPLTSA